MAATDLRTHLAWFALSLFLQAPALWLMAVSLDWHVLPLAGLLITGLASAVLASRLGARPPVVLSAAIGLVAVMIAFAAQTGALSVG